MDETSTKQIFPTAKVALSLSTETKAGYIQLLKVYVQALRAQLQLSPKGPDQEKQRMASPLLRINGVTRSKQNRSGIGYISSCFKQE